MSNINNNNKQGFIEEYNPIPDTNTLQHKGMVMQEVALAIRVLKEYRTNNSNFGEFIYNVEKTYSPKDIFDELKRLNYIFKYPDHTDIVEDFILLDIANNDGNHVCTFYASLFDNTQYFVIDEDDFI